MIYAINDSKYFHNWILQHDKITNLNQIVIDSNRNTSMQGFENIQNMNGWNSYILNGLTLNKFIYCFKLLLPTHIEIYWAAITAKQ